MRLPTLHESAYRLLGDLRLYFIGRSVCHQLIADIEQIDEEGICVSRRAEEIGVVIKIFVKTVEVYRNRFDARRAALAVSGEDELFEQPFKLLARDACVAHDSGDGELLKRCLMVRLGPPIVVSALGVRVSVF